MRLEDCHYDNPPPFYISEGKAVMTGAQQTIVPNAEKSNPDLFYNDTIAASVYICLLSSA